jgi:hypothetical protein
MPAVKIIAFLEIEQKLTISVLKTLLKTNKYICEIET